MRPRRRYVLAGLTGADVVVLYQVVVKGVGGVSASQTLCARLRRLERQREREWRADRGCATETGVVGLGQMQVGFLRALVGRGRWVVRERWRNAGPSHIVRMCESFARRGLAQRRPDEDGAAVYAPTEVARAWVREQA